VVMMTDTGGAQDIIVYTFIHFTLPYLTLPSGWASYYTCPALRPYQFSPMRNSDVTVGRSNRGCRQLWSRSRRWSQKSPVT